ncbi:hypothetical protein [Eisenibacter elegans]|uniref:hypothetical protein n=1 Tax=Eisenibacter elegans TaxID=997 RepID=UPI0003FF3A8A|nr:hypothetical protein [Eisenibacter elegans]
MNKFSIRVLLMLALSFVVLTSCSRDKDPEPANEEELITTLEMKFTPQGGGQTITFLWRDGALLPGRGTNQAPALAPNTTYNVAIELLDETQTPPEDITEEIEEEDDEHQFFFIISSGLNLTHQYNDRDGDGRAVGLKNIFTTGPASTGTLRVILKHKLNKAAAANLVTPVTLEQINGFGGDTDVDLTFNVTIQ